MKRFIRSKSSVPTLRSVCGNYLETLIPDFIAKGNYQYRLLQKPLSTSFRAKRSKASAALVLQEVTRKPKWKIISNLAIHNVESALKECTGKDVLYNFGRVFPAIDLAANYFCDLFQVTVDSSHLIHLETILAICKFVRKKTTSQVVRLYFVVPVAVFENYQNWQSFKCTSVDGAHFNCTFTDLSEEDQETLSNLEQYVVAYD